MRILNVVGARPNLIKIAPLIEELRLNPAIEQILVHTGQHYDRMMSEVFFDELGIPKPDIYLGVGSGTHAEQTARVMMALETVLEEQKPDVVVVVGDVNSTLASAITAAKLSIPVAHIEAGLRSFDRRMPEEINRVVTDTLADLLFTTESAANENLRREGIPGVKIHFVGNIMIDALKKHKVRAESMKMPARLGVTEGHYALVTLHRPSNVDEPDVLQGIINALGEIQKDIPVLFPVHPRTRQRIESSIHQSWLASMPALKLLPPQGYLEFLSLMMHARLVLTDSGGIQEETTALGVPCLTLRDNTERPVTLTVGTNQLVGTSPSRIVATTRDVLSGGGKAGTVPELWDGRAAQRIVDVLQRFGGLATS